jgi:hypothetical protein
LLTADCSCLVEISTVSLIAMTAVLSANVAMVIHSREFEIFLCSNGHQGVEFLHHVIQRQT